MAVLEEKLYSIVLPEAKVKVVPVLGKADEAEKVAFPVPLILKLAKGVLTVPVLDALVQDKKAFDSINNIPELATLTESGLISLDVLNVPDAIRILFALIAVVAVPV